MQYEFKKFQVIWQCLSFGNVSAIGKPPHHNRGCYLESTKADWQYEYDFKTLSSILAMCVFGQNGAICICIGYWAAFSVNQRKLGSMNLISRHFEYFGNVCLLA